MPSPLRTLLLLQPRLHSVPGAAQLRRRRRRRRSRRRRGHPRQGRRRMRAGGGAGGGEGAAQPHPAGLPPCLPLALVGGPVGACCWVCRCFASPRPFTRAVPTPLATAPQPTHNPNRALPCPPAAQRAMSSGEDMLRSVFKPAMAGPDEAGAQAGAAHQNPVRWFLQDRWGGCGVGAGWVGGGRQSRAGRLSGGMGRCMWSSYLPPPSFFGLPAVWVFDWPPAIPRPCFPQDCHAARGLPPHAALAGLQHRCAPGAGMGWGLLLPACAEWVALPRPHWLCGAPWRPPLPPTQEGPILPCTAELKYPTLTEVGAMRAVFYSRNTFVDEVLKVGRWPVGSGERVLLCLGLAFVLRGGVLKVLWMAGVAQGLRRA